MNKKLKKIIPVILILVAVVAFYLGVSYIVNQKRGNIRNVERSMAESSVYSEGDIISAMNTVQNHFFLIYDGSTLTDLWYPGDETLAVAEEWAIQYDADEAIVLLSNFDVDSSGGDGSLNPDSIYSNWQWILTRDGDEDWVLETWRY